MSEKTDLSPLDDVDPATLSPAWRRVYEALSRLRNAEKEGEAG